VLQGHFLFLLAKMLDLRKEFQQFAVKKQILLHFADTFLDLKWLFYKDNPTTTLRLLKVILTVYNHIEKSNITKQVQNLVIVATVSNETRTERSQTSTHRHPGKERDSTPIFGNTMDLLFQKTLRWWNKDEEVYLNLSSVQTPVPKLIWPY